MPPIVAFFETQIRLQIAQAYLDIRKPRGECFDGWRRSLALEIVDQLGKSQRLGIVWLSGNGFVSVDLRRQNLDSKRGIELQ